MRRTWTWTFDLPPDELWPVLADTNRFNEAMGLPAYCWRRRRRPTARSCAAAREGGGLHPRMGGEAYEWIHGRHFRQARVHQPVPPLRAGSISNLTVPAARR
jgi:hypothetical protein